MTQVETHVRCFLPCVVVRLGLVLETNFPSSISLCCIFSSIPRHNGQHWFVLLGLYWSALVDHCSDLSYSQLFLAVGPIRHLQQWLGGSILPPPQQVLCPMHAISIEANTISMVPCICRYSLLLSLLLSLFSINRENQSSERLFKLH